MFEKHCEVCNIKDFTMNLKYSFKGQLRTVLLLSWWKKFLQTFLLFTKSMQKHHII